MNTTALVRRYSTLSPWERVPLIVAASLRDDETEARQLARSAPKIAWELPHHFGLAEGVRDVAVAYLLNQLDAAALHWETAFVLAEHRPPPETRRTVQSICSGGLRLNALLSARRADAWKLFCAELHVDGDALLREWACHDKVRHFEAAARCAAFSEEEAAGWLQSLAKERDPDGPERRFVFPSAAAVAAEMRAHLEQRLAEWT